MTFKLALTPSSMPAWLPFNYQYPLSSAIYKTIQYADAAYAAFLHQKGYGEGHKNFKLFTFSDVRTPFERQDDRMRLLTNKAELLLCFYIPDAAENFIKGLFINRELEIADKKSKVRFQVQQIEAIDNGYGTNHRKGDEMVTVQLQPQSPLVTGRKNAQGNYDYRSPTDADFTDCLIYNWLEKYQAVHQADQQELAALRAAIQIEVKLFPHLPQQRLIAIKQGTPAETKIRGYLKFRLVVTAPAAMLSLALGAGLGLNNAMGCGCVGVVV